MRKISVKNTNDTAKPTAASTASLRLHDALSPSKGLCVTKFSVLLDILLPPTQNNYKSIDSKKLYVIMENLVTFLLKFDTFYTKNH